MIILTIGDMHYRENLIRLKEMMEVEILKIIKDVKPDIIVVLGDTLHWHNDMKVSMHSHVTKFFHSLSSFCPLFVIIGNHDRQNNSDFLSSIHPFPSLDDNENIFVIYDTRSFVIGGKRLILVPYVPPGRFHEALERVEDYKTADLIFAHQEFLGSTPSGEGDVWDKNDPWVITGHIHDYRRLQRNILYTGTPTQDVYSEGTNKSISVFNDESGKFVEERWFLNALPKMYKYEIYADDFSNFDLADILGEIRKIDKITVILKGTKSQIDVIMKSYKVKTWTKLGVRVKPLVASELIEVRELRNFEDEVNHNMPKELVSLFDMLKGDIEPGNFILS